MSDDEPWWRAFFEDVYADVQLADRDDAAAAADVDVIVRRLGLDSKASVLDIPCGAGRHSLELARRGYAVAGVDFNARVVDAARARAEAESLNATFVVGDMRSVVLERGFDGAFCWFGSFGYFDDTDNTAFLAHVASLLQPGARFVIDTVVTETIYPRFRERDWRWIGDGDARIRSIEERSYDHATATLTSTWTRSGHHGENAATSVMRLYAYREITERMRAAGFVDIEGFDGSTDAPFRLGAQRLTVVGTR